MKRHLPHILLHIALAVALIVVIVSAPLSLIELSQQPKAPKAPVAVVNAHVCDRHDYVTGCALPQATVKEIIRGVDPTVQGVDFAWSCALSHAQGFGASYLSYDSSKNWSRSCVDQFHAAHKATVAVWEAGANDATGGYSLGFNQARQAASELAALGAPAHQPFTMAIDCDCAPSSLTGYFQGANKAEPGRINAYGGYNQILYLYQHHLVGHLNWQTYAWSGGRWLPASIAPLEQYLNSTSVDYDRAIASNYGQWPAPAPPKPPAPKLRCFGKGWTHNATCNRVRAQDATLGRLRNRELGYAKVSEHNLAVISARLALEKRKAAAYNAQLEKSLGQYGYKPRH